MNITYRDINHRRCELEQPRPTNAPDGIYRLYDKVVNTEYSFTESLQVLRYWRELHEDTNIAFSRVMDIFEAATYNDTTENIECLTRIISEEISNKVRSAKEFQQNVSMKKGKFKTPNRKITTATRTANKNIPNTQEGAKAWEAQHGYHAKPYGGFKKVDDNFVESCYDTIYEAGLKMEQCDRILANNANLNKRFNFDKIIRESDDFDDTIETLCEFVNTYNAPFEARYNTTLENTFYSLSKNGIQFSNEELIDQITDYFLMTETIGLDGAVLDSIHYILSESKIFTESETKHMTDFLDGVYETSTINNVNDALNVYVEGVKAIDPDVEFRKFKAQPVKDPNMLKTILYRIYAGHPGDVVDDLTNIFRIFRILIVAGSFINPILGLVTFITDYCLKTKYGRAGLKAAIEKYDKEIIRVNKKIKNAGDDNVKNSFKQYKDKLLTARGMLDSALDKLHTEKENDDRHEKEDTSKLYDDGENEFDFDFDFDFDEAVSLVTALSAVCESSAWTNDITGLICEKMQRTTLPEDIETISEFCSLCPDIIDKYRISKTADNAITENVSQKRYDMVPALAHCKESLNSNNYDISFKDSYEIYENTKYKEAAIVDMLDFCSDTFSEAAATFNTEKESAKYKESFKKNVLSTRNKVITAMATLKRDMIKLTDKERMLSKRVDMSLETIRDNINRSFESSNREAVIKGTILPKASTCIKIAITTGAAWAIQPALAVVGLLGYIGINKSMRKKERQIIVDDIDIELNMCNRYIRHFEEKGDMEALRNVMKTQRELQRQRNRLVYNMGMVHNEKPDKLPKIGAEESMSYINISNLVDEKIVINEGKRHDILNGVNPWSNKKLFHISFEDLGETTTMEPRIPTYLKDMSPEELKYQADHGFPENNKIARICVSASINGCLRAILNCEKIMKKSGDKFYVYIPEKPIEKYKHMTNKELNNAKYVFDSNITGEAWILEPCKMVLYGIGRFDAAVNTRCKKTVGGSKIGALDCKWSWAVNPRVIRTWLLDDNTDESDEKKSVSEANDIDHVKQDKKDVLNASKEKVKDAMNDSKEKVKDTANDAGNYVVNKTRDELSRGAAKDKKIFNKKLTRQQMLDNPELLKKYIEDEEDDPVLTLNRLVDVLLWAFDMSTTVQTFIVDKIKYILKSSVNIADPRVKVAFKTTRHECEKAIDQLTKEIAKESDPIKQRSLKNQRKKLQDCLIAVDNKLDDKDAKNLKEDLKDDK